MTKLDPAGPYCCSHCGSGFVSEESGLTCDGCGTHIPVRNGILLFPLSDDGPPTDRDPFETVAPIYETPMWFPTLYRLVAGPAAPTDVRVISRMIGASPGQMLDVACGTGRLARRLAPDADGIWAMDRSRAMLERGVRLAERATVTGISFAEMDATEMWYRSNTFESAVCGWALHLFQDPAAVLREIRRVLQFGGRLVGTTLTERWVLRDPIVQAASKRALGATAFPVESVRDLLARAGFHDIRLETYGGALVFRGIAPERGNSTGSGP